MCSTHQLSFAHLHMEEETGALWIYTANNSPFPINWKFRCFLFHDHEEINPAQHFIELSAPPLQPLPWGRKPLEIPSGHAIASA